MDIAKRILELCEQNYVTVNHLAEISFLTQSTLQNIVSGRNKTVQVDTIEKICIGLDITLAEFFTEKEPEFPPEAMKELKLFKEYLEYKYIIKEKTGE